MTKRLLPMVFVLAVLPGTAQGISEVDFEQGYDTQVRPYFESFEFGSFAGAAGVQIAYAVHEVENEDGALVILHGKSESCIKYAELAYDLRGLQCSVYLMDHRGMGLSGRMIADDPERVHVQWFDDYVRDVKRFVDTIVNRVPHRRRLLVAHSLGGAIGARYLEQHPGDFDAAVLSSPMLLIDTGSYSEQVAFLIAELATAVGLGRQYALGQGPREEPIFDNNTVTGSYARWSMWEEQLIPEHPEVVSGGASYRWVRNSLVAGRMSRAMAGNVGVPLLLFQAGQDCIVMPAGHEDFCDSAQDCQLVRFDGARHEILMESDDIRNQAVADILAFFAEHG